MKLVKVGAAVLNQVPMDWDHNHARILEAIQRARADSVRLLCLPEMCITGYGCEDAFLSPSMQATALELLVELAAQTQGMMVCFGLPVMYQNALYNGVGIACDGRLVGIVPKQNLAGDGLHYEPRWFRRWHAGVRGEKRVGDGSVPIGDLHFDCGGVRVGFEICEDAWVANRPGAALASRGVDIILNPSASHFAFGKRQVRERFVLDGSRAFGVTYVYTNLVGNEAGRAVYDGGALIASGGRLVASGERLSMREVDVVSAVVDVHATRMIQSRTASFQPEMDGDESDRVALAFDWPADLRLEAPRCELPDWEDSATLKEEEFTRAIALALHDYRRKCRARGYAVSLSGGADSAACAALVAAALRLAGNEDEVHERLLCVYQSTENSSETTLNAARVVAEALGARFMVLDVDPLVRGYIGLTEEALGRELTWAQDDLALQNVQARVRGPSIWMLTNILGFLLLATSNRSEAAVGYATMDGDTCGGISPIAGIDKAFLRQWLRWMETDGPRGLGPLPALAAVNVQQPTAELRPAEMGQTDEGDLMPYPVLDAIERAAIRDKHDPVGCYRVVAARMPQYTAEQLGVWVERFFVLFCRNQWKRERYAPSFHVDDESLDPKTWCRFPILSGGYARELRALRALVQAEAAK